MGKIRTRFLGDEEIEKKQKAKSKERAKRKKRENALDTSPAPSVESDSTSGETSKDLPSRREYSDRSVGGRDVSKALKKEPGKKYNHALKQIEGNKTYSIPDGVALLKKISYTSFDETLELHITIFEKNQRGEVALPHSTGHTLKVAVVDDALLDSIASGTLDFDVLVAHPSFMPKLAKHAKVLGPKGLMPNPKAGTISTEPEKVAEKLKSGTLHWKSESKFPLIHQRIAKFSLDTKSIGENIEAFIASVGKKNIKDIFLSGSMTPSVKIEME